MSERFQQTTEKQPSREKPPPTEKQPSKKKPPPTEKPPPTREQPEWSFSSDDEEEEEPQNLCIRDWVSARPNPEQFLPSQLEGISIPGIGTEMRGYEGPQQDLNWDQLTQSALFLQTSLDYSAWYSGFQSRATTSYDQNSQNQGVGTGPAIRTDLPGCSFWGDHYQRAEVGEQRIESNAQAAEINPAPTFPNGNEGNLGPAEPRTTMTPLCNTCIPVPCNELIGVICKNCGDMFTSCPRASGHACNSDATFMCRICNQRFQTAFQYSVHEVSHGTESAPFLCPNCGSTFETRPSFKKHVSRQCPVISPYGCVYCHRRYTTEANLLRHMRTHR